jgi:ubiquinone/menaquinone biosynthesis C-methylase UbiE
MTFDAAQFKRLERTGYNRLGRRYLDAAARRAILAEGLLAAADLSPGLTVLDLASGPGLLASAAAQTLGTTGFVIASDIAEAQLACCPPHAGLARVVADGEHLPFATASLDRVMCGLGLMLFPDADVALAEMRRVLRPRGRLALSVWASAEDVPLIEVALSCIRRLLPAPKVARPSIFRFGDAPDLQRRLTSADFCDIRITSLQFSLDFPDAASYWQAFLDLAGGAAESLARLPDAKQAELAREVAVELAPYAIPATTGGYRLDSRILIATGQTSISTGPI